MTTRWRTEPDITGRWWLTVTHVESGRFYKSDAHADRCIPILKEMCERDFGSDSRIEAKHEQVRWSEAVSQARRQ